MKFLTLQYCHKLVKLRYDFWNFWFCNWLSEIFKTTLYKKNDRINYLSCRGGFRRWWCVGPLHHRDRRTSNNQRLGKVGLRHWRRYRSRLQRYRIPARSSHRTATRFCNRNRDKKSGWIFWMRYMHFVTKKKKIKKFKKKVLVVRAWNFTSNRICKYNKKKVFFNKLSVYCIKHAKNFDNFIKFTTFLSVSGHYVQLTRDKKPKTGTKFVCMIYLYTLLFIHKDFYIHNII